MEKMFNAINTFLNYHILEITSTTAMKFITIINSKKMEIKSILDSNEKE